MIYNFEADLFAEKRNHAVNYQKRSDERFCQNLLRMKVWQLELINVYTNWNGARAEHRFRQKKIPFLRIHPTDT